MGGLYSIDDLGWNAFRLLREAHLHAPKPSEVFGAFVMNSEMSATASDVVIQLPNVR
jgi:hypothetical protein